MQIISLRRKILAQLDVVVRNCSTAIAAALDSKAATVASEFGVAEADLHKISMAMDDSLVLVGRCLADLQKRKAKS